MKNAKFNLVLLMLFAAGLELWELFKPVSIDEFGQIDVARGSLAAITTQFYEAQNHPLYGILAHFALRLRPLPVLIAARMPALLAGLALAWTFYRGRRIWVGPEAAVLATLAFLFVDPVKHYATSARGYVFLMLGAVVLADLLLDYLERGGPARLAAYVAVAVAACYAHLWMLPVLGAHGVFLATEALRPSGDRPDRARLAGAAAAIVAAVVLAMGAYAPMIPEIIAMGSHHVPGVMGARLIEALLQSIRYGSWTLAMHVVLVSVVLEGIARRGENPLGDRAVRLHGTIIHAVVAFAMVVNPLNFGSRFLLGITPSIYALVAWALGGYWHGKVSCGRVPVLPALATSLIGLALGIVVANAPLSHEIPPRTNVQTHDDYQGEYYHMLPKELGNRTAGAFLGIGVLGVALRRWLAPLSRRLTTMAIPFWTLVLMAAVVPLALGPYALEPRGLFEVHMVAVAGVALLAWQNRFDDRALHRLTLAFLACALVAGLWQAGFLLARFDLVWGAKMMLYIPPLVIISALARTTRCPG
jgi:hypothetical protein